MSPASAIVHRVLHSHNLASIRTYCINKTRTGDCDTQILKAHYSEVGSCTGTGNSTGVFVSAFTRVTAHRHLGRGGTSSYVAVLENVQSTPAYMPESLMPAVQKHPQCARRAVVEVHRDMSPTRLVKSSRRNQMHSKTKHCGTSYKGRVTMFEELIAYPSSRQRSIVVVVRCLLQGDCRFNVKCRSKT